MITVPAGLKSKRWLFLPPILIGLAAVAAMARSRRELVRLPTAEQAVRVQVIRAQRSKLSPQATGYGTARPARIWRAVAEVRGSITSRHPRLRSGNRVDEGDVLVEIDQLDYRLRVEQREADLAAARAGVEQLLASQAADKTSLELEEKLLRVTDRELKRLSQLSQTSAASQSEADRAEGDWLRQTQAAQQLRNSLSIYPARIAAARASVSLAEARLSEAQRDLARTRIVAPFAGVLSGVEIEAKQVVAQSAPLFQLHDTDTIEIDAQFSPSQIMPVLRTPQAGGHSTAYTSVRDAIQSGRLTASVIARSGDAEVHWPARVLRLTESLDPSTRTLGIVVSVDNTASAARPLSAGRPLAPAKASGLPPSDLRLLPGVYCEVTLSATDGFDSIAIPETASTAGTVFVIDQDNRLHQREVTIAYRDRSQLAIIAGLEVGELVAVKPPMPAIEGMLVMPELDSANRPAVDRRP